MKYIVTEDELQIVETLDTFDVQKLERTCQRIANELGKSVYVIDGQHYGITCDPEAK